MAYEFFERVYHRDILEFGAEGAIIIAYLRFKQEFAEQERTLENEAGFWFRANLNAICDRLNLSLRVVRTRCSEFIANGILKRRKLPHSNESALQLDVAQMESVLVKKTPKMPKGDFGGKLHFGMTQNDVSAFSNTIEHTKKHTEEINTLTETEVSVTFEEPKTIQEKEIEKPQKETKRQKSSRLVANQLAHSETPNETKKAQQQALKSVSEGTELFNHYQNLYCERYKAVLARNEPRSRVCKQLVKNYGLELSKKIVSQYLLDNDSFFRGHPLSLLAMEKNQQMLEAKALGGAVPTNAQARMAEKEQLKNDVVIQVSQNLKHGIDSEFSKILNSQEEDLEFQKLLLNAKTKTQLESAKKTALS